jgi:5-deoxy-5-amino-3-dehydroquinate synthase
MVARGRDSGALWRRVDVALPERGYSVHIGPGVRDLLPGIVEQTRAGRAAVVSSQPFDLIPDTGVRTLRVAIKDGEDGKTLAAVQDLCARFAEFGLTRADAVIACGGGTTTDLAGLAAALYHRGVPVIHLPTSLLAQVDASVGGKTAVNLPQGKNLIGTYWQPTAVLCDTDYLATLPAREWTNGYGEIARCHFIGAGDLRGLPVTDQIAASVARKAEIVAADERDTGLRHLLNYGHTLGHALERATNFAVRHGEGVAIGTVFAGTLAGTLGRIDADRVEEHLRVVRGYGLPTAVPAELDPDLLISLMRLDKKATNGLTFVLDGPHGAEIVPQVSEDVVRRVLLASGEDTTPSELPGLSALKERLLMDALTAEVLGDVTLVFVVSSLLGAVARRCGQPTVIGQILAGVLLGPTLLGRLPGDPTSRLFPSHVLPYLTVLSQIAVTIFMFSVGYEIKPTRIRGNGRAVPLIIVSALAVPMALGMACVLLFRSDFMAIGEMHKGHSFLLFMGVVTSITALPVLASIVRERGLAGTVVGVTATAAAGGMDVLAWLLLAAALIGSGHSGRPLWMTLLGIGCFTAVMLTAIPLVLSWWARRTASIFSNPVPVAFALAMGSGWVTAMLGLHPIFGGFIAGLAMRAGSSEPDADVFRSLDQAGNLLLPLFFIVTGLSLNLGAMGGDAFVLLGLILAAATVGKLGPAYAVSRACGLKPRESAAIAALVNTRGLTELIALNTGLADGIIDQRLFTVLVLMALITTLMAGPLLSLIQPSRLPQTTVAERMTNL